MGKAVKSSRLIMGAKLNSLVVWVILMGVLAVKPSRLILWAL